MAALLALLSAFTYGAGDFFGGLAARRLPAVAVAWRSNAIGLAGLLVVAQFVTAEQLEGRDLVLGAVGGIVGGLGLILLFRGLATGTMSVVAPITAVLSAVVPVLVGLGGGERPSALALAGVPLALVAVAALARDPDREGPVTGMARQDVLLALGAGLGFGFFFVALDATGDGAGVWPVVAGRAASVAMFTAVVAVVRSTRVGDDRARRGTTPWLLVGCGLGDAGANALFLLATQRGFLTLVAVLAALYPASTVLLARFVLGERLVGSQRVGIALAGLAVVVVSAG
jgi:drug/metabolite transporter (DMT)-like permease